MRVPYGFVFVFVTQCAAASLPAQCTTPWLPGPSVPGVVGDVYATATWDPDGAGPLLELLVVGGSFTIAGDGLRSNIACVDRATGVWSSLGTGTNGPVRALATLPNGELVAAGAFLQAGGVAAARVARWNGAGWSPLGSGFDDEVRALSLGPNGNLMAVGLFLTAGGVPCNRAAQWNGTSWAACGSGLNGTGMALAQLPSGEIVAGGPFSTAGGVQVGGVARWDGVAWSAFGSGPGVGNVQCVAVAPNGDVAVGGGYPATLARWNGASWTVLPPAHVVVTAVTFLTNGDLLAHGVLPYGAGLLSRWNGAWSNVTGVYGTVFSLRTSTNGTVVLGGGFRLGGGVGVVTWDGASFAPVGPGFDNGIGAVCAMPDGSMVVGGGFTRAGAIAANCIARWNGANWAALGSGLNSSVVCVTALPNGDVVAGGMFTQAGGVPVNKVARWNGTAWSALGGGATYIYYVPALATLPNGQVAAAQVGATLATTVVRWDGAAWQPLGAAMNSVVNALLVRPNGDLVAAGEFTAPASRIARWDGTTWSPIGTGLPGRVFGVANLPNGDLVASGDSVVWRWNGVAWSQLGGGFNGTIRAVAGLPDGDVLATGYFLQASGQPSNSIARWNGGTWSPVGAGLNGDGVALGRLANDDVVVVGNFTTAGGQVSGSMARLSTTCPADATPFGVGCTGSGGLNTHAATALPWIGSTFRAEATGMPANGFVAAVTGFTPLAIALPWVLVEALPGCQGLVTADAVEVLLPSGGRVQTQLAIPDQPTLVGVAFHQYVVAFELGGAGITAITSSNALTMHVGSF